MLTITLPHPKYGDFTRAWSVGQIFPVSYGMVGKVLEVQADAEELNLVKSLCTGVPLHSGNVIRWFGEDAKFIVGALRAKMIGS